MEGKTIIFTTLITGVFLITFSANYPSRLEFRRDGWHKDVGRKHGKPSPLLAASSKKIDINEFLIGVIENFREDMLTGISDLKVPVLDPFVPKKPFNVDVEDSKASLHGNFTDVVVEGMSGFVMEYMNADIQNLSLQFHLRIPWMKGSGNYSIDGKVIKIVPIRGNGEFWVESYNLSLAAKASLEMSEGDTHLQLSKDFDVLIDFEKVEMYLENFLGGGKWTEVLLKILNDVSKDVFKKFLPLLKDALNNSLLKVINKHLMKLPITSIIPGSTADEYIDQILENVHNYVKNNKLDPMQLPDYVSTFSKEIVYVNFTGEAKLHDGWLSGVSTLRRTDECELNTTRTTISVSAHLGLSNLRVSYRGKAKFMALGPSIIVGGKVNTVEFYFRIRQTNKKGAKPVLEEFEIMELSTIWIELSGLGPLTWVLKWLLTGISKLVEDFIVNKVTEKVQEYMQAEFEKLSFPV
ncbi:uncharacterized protein [Parasteatoda tepidariorum]|uniref:uncharacterized protein n=1 Tax=Parasteatoda tepidariorum TaxID=114398 RepID=UPI00077F9F4F|nr:uncharacterized protein LOC107439415 [Parasteatoda tepidariorum]XP_042901153.1 uncharacterized protein LOC107439415 [Parasteatoda tepidariorum]XP_042901154.1 uncharacterized protein LOC107439415 [Parasteatoda tepidariorum]XP_042901155.1 uncharacterized protein LOC107439415 [Parasteatoda tepidariorum]